MSVYVCTRYLIWLELSTQEVLTQSACLILFVLICAAWNCYGDKISVLPTLEFLLGFGPARSFLRDTTHFLLCAEKVYQVLHKNT